jgi:hypothetical protein
VVVEAVVWEEVWVEVFLEVGQERPLEKERVPVN